MGMNGIFVFGFDKEIGVQLYINAVKNLTSSGTIERRHDYCSTLVVMYDKKAFVHTNHDSI